MLQVLSAKRASAGSGSAILDPPTQDTSVTPSTDIVRRSKYNVKSINY